MVLGNFRHHNDPSKVFPLQKQVWRKCFDEFNFNIFTKNLQFSFEIYEKYSFASNYERYFKNYTFNLYIRFCCVKP